MTVSNLVGSMIGKSAALHQPYNVETFGEFRKMMLTGDFTPKVQLGSAMAKHPTTGVGAVADARGEISIFDGRLVVSYGKTRAPRLTQIWNMRLFWPWPQRPTGKVFE